MFVALILLGGVMAFVMTADRIGDVRSPAPIVFVCRNGVAMSLWSAAYFNRLAGARRLAQRAIARASIPSFDEVPLNMVFALTVDRFRLDGFRPRVVSDDEIRRAELVVAIEELPRGIDPEHSVIEVWDGFPPMREKYFASRRVLKARVEALVERLAAGQTDGAGGVANSSR
jgi:hypothetical protein